MHQDLLTQDEILQVLEEAKKPDWLMPNLMNPIGGKTSIFRVLATKGLIMVNGNESTGLQHIEHRHRFGRQVWREDKDELENSSEIRFGVAPYDYITIAGSIYKPENLRPELNKRPDDFDFYMGGHVHRNGDLVEYRLLTYKGTGIIHTLFPSKSDNKSKKLLKYRQCGIGLVNDIMRGTYIYTIPYKDKSETEVFRLVIRGIRSHPVERWYVQINEGNPVNPQTIFLKEIVLSAPVQHGPLRAFFLSDAIKYEFEQIVLKILREQYKPDPKEKLHVTEGRTTTITPTYFAW
ncbi:hypothetical protein [Spirosoma fluminis]